MRTVSDARLFSEPTKVFTCVLILPTNHSLSARWTIGAVAKFLSSCETIIILAALLGPCATESTKCGVLGFYLVIGAARPLAKELGKNCGSSHHLWESCNCNARSCSHHRRSGPPRPLPTRGTSAERRS